MRWLLKCKACGSTCWAGGVDEPDVNALTIEEPIPEEWDPENDCSHDDYEIIDEEFPEPEPPWEPVPYWDD